MYRARAAEMVGSSPRVRGTCSNHLAVIVPSPVHPRVCGERFNVTPSKAARNGSSPRVRGTCQHTLEGATPGRFIPACAGNVQNEWFASRSSAVHPRVCGERQVSHDPSDRGDGSSPRVRGTYLYMMLADYPTRFIPACAGNVFVLVYFKQP